MADKTEEPTPRRLRKARSEGDSPLSSYAAQSMAFVVAVALVPGTVAATWHHAAGDLRRVALALSDPSNLTMSPLVLALDGSVPLVIALVLPLLVAVGASGALAHVVQTGGAFAPGRLALELDRLDPASGFKRLFSLMRLFAVARSLVAGGLVAAFAYATLSDHLGDLARMAGRPQWVGPAVSALGRSLAWKVAVLGVFLGALDLIVMRRAWLRRLRMTKEEVKREVRESEGDPHMKAARDRAHRELLTEATLANVRNATVVVVNPTHLACALRYDESAGDSAPVVLAAGEGALASGIVRAAQTFGVPVIEDVPLAHALLELSPGSAIPEALYVAVAEILREVAAGERAR